MKPYFEQGNIKIYHGDCREILPQLNPRINLIVTSPPYNAAKEYGDCTDDLSIDAYWDFTADWLTACTQVLQQGGWAAINIPFWYGSRPKTFMPGDFIRIIEQAGLTYKDWITWVKGSLESPVANTAAWGNYPTTMSLRSSAEPILIGRKGTSEPTKKDITWTEWVKWSVNVWTMPCGQNKGHPATFPLELPYRLIKMYGAPDDVILDPFLGSGTTLEAAQKLGRSAIGIELSEAYCELSASKLAQLSLF